MTPISYVRQRVPPEVIRPAVWLDLSFTLSYRDVRDLLLERGLNELYDTIRRWARLPPELACFILRL